MPSSGLDNPLWIINYILKHYSDDLSEWEEKFMKDMRRRNRKDWSDKQFACYEKIRKRFLWTIEEKRDHDNRNRLRDQRSDSPPK